MKKIIYLLIAFLAIAGLESCNDSKPLELNVMTFNIRYDNSEDSLNNWKYRKEVVAQTVLNYDVDILGTQEVLANQLKDMKIALSDYKAIGVGREDGIAAGEFSALFYKKDKFKEIESGTFWLSQTPDIAGSKGWDAACERVATWAFLEDVATQKRFFAINTHLDHVGAEARINGVKLMLEKAHEKAGDLPVVLTGDFNSEPSSDVVQFITSDLIPNKLISTRDHAIEKKDKGWTFHDFEHLPSDQRQYIDYIFVSKDVQVLNYEVVDEKLNDILVSDHNPVVAKIIIK
mgnify:CR=1 FL=1